jgi:D-3-phosphoglycerate dehydrogenase
MKMKVLHIEENHPSLTKGLDLLGFQNDLAFNDSLPEVLAKIGAYDGLILRSKFKIDKTFILHAKNLKFIGRVGAGIENIDVQAVKNKNIYLINAPEGNRNAVGEHCVGMLLGLMNNLKAGHESIQAGQWDRDGHRGWELSGRTIGIIGYGNTGKSFAQRVSGFDVSTLCYDILDNVGDENALQVSMEELMTKSEVISIHTPHTPITRGIIDYKFIEEMNHSFWLLNTARGSAVVTEDLVTGLQSGKIMGAGLDVLEYETRSFSSIFNDDKIPLALEYLIQAKNVILSPHVGGWTRESQIKLATTIVEKIKKIFF